MAVTWNIMGLKPTEQDWQHILKPDFV